MLEKWAGRKIAKLNRYECETLRQAGGAPATGAALQKGPEGANVARRSREGRDYPPYSTVFEPCSDTVSSFGTPSAGETSKNLE